MIDQPIANDFEDELIAGEKLLWANKPRSGIMFEKADWFHIPLTLIFTGVSIAIFTAVHRTDKNSGFQWYILFFVIAGFYELVGRFFYDSWRRANISYAITGLRVIIRHGVFSKTYKSIYISDIKELNTKPKPDGSGTIIFGPDIVVYWMRRMPRTDFPPKFELITNMQEVYNLLLTLKEESTNGHPEPHLS